MKSLLTFLGITLISGLVAMQLGAFESKAFTETGEVKEATSAQHSNMLSMDLSECQSIHEEVSAGISKEKAIKDLNSRLIGTELKNCPVLPSYKNQVPETLVFNEQ